MSPRPQSGYSPLLRKCLLDYINQPDHKDLDCLLIRDLLAELLRSLGVVLLVSVQDHLEFLESLMIRYLRPDSQERADVDG